MEGMRARVEARSARGNLSLMQSELHVDLRWFQVETTAVTTTTTTTAAVTAASNPLSWHIPRPSLVGRSERDSENGSWAHHLHPNSPSRGSTSSQGSTASTHVNSPSRLCTSYLHTTSTTRDAEVARKLILK